MSERTKRRAPPPATAAVLRAFAAHLAGSPHNLVSRGDRGAVYERHVLDAWAIARALPVRPGARWLDLGTGGGLPGLPAALAHPESEWLLLDASTKKTREVERFARGHGIGNVAVVAGRAEQLARTSRHRGAYEGVVARALARLDVVGELARGFTRPGGWLAAVKGAEWEPELAVARGALERLGWTEIEAFPVTSSPRGDTWVVRMRADGEPPREAPRRTGVPARRPLGGPG